MTKPDRPEKVRGTEAEVDVLMDLKDSVPWAILKRMAVRYIRNLQKVSFKLMETDSHLLAVRHAELTGQALGIQTLIKMVDNLGKKKE